MLKICKACNIEKDVVNNFRAYKNRSGEIRYIGYCIPCKNKRSQAQKSPETIRAGHIKQQAKRTLNRKKLINVENFIYEDMRRLDKKRGHENNLTKDFIRDTIANGCCYCGEKDMRMTLDRIDNTRGHTMDNCIPACLRCNNIRSNMPYYAWLEIAPSIKRARKKDMFGKWVGGTKQFIE